MQFAILRRSDRLTDADCAFIAEACHQQMLEAAAAWGVQPVPVDWYAKAEGLPVRNCIIATIVDELDEPGSLAYHADSLGVIYIRVLAQSVADTGVSMSHEVLEALVDPHCDRWMPIAKTGRHVAIEIADPVQSRRYQVEATVLGETRKVWVSDYVNPIWFDGTAHAGPFDRMNELTAPLSMAPGSYMIVRDFTGDVENVFAEAIDPEGYELARKRMERAESRTKLRIEAPRRAA